MKKSINWNIFNYEQSIWISDTEATEMMPTLTRDFSCQARAETKSSFSATSANQEWMTNPNSVARLREFVNFNRGYLENH